MSVLETLLWLLVIVAGVFVAIFVLLVVFFLVLCYGEIRRDKIREKTLGSWKTDE